MGVSVLTYKNHQNASMEKYDPQKLIFLIFRHKPARFLQLLVTGYPY